MAEDKTSQDDLQISPAGAGGQDPKSGQQGGQQGDQKAAGTGAAGSDAAGQSQYAVPALVKEKIPDLMQLIKETESMNEEERDYWHQILPIMTEDQISKFRDILLNEKQQLEKLDAEYEDELNKLNEKHMIEWKEFETKEKRKAIAGAEADSEREEKLKEEELLARLAEI